MTRALVTGGAGFIGSNLVRALLDAQISVVVLDDLSSGREELVPADAELIQGSVTSLDDLERAFEPAPDVVLHLAALFANQNSVEHPDRDLQVNGEGTLNVLRISADRGVRKVLNVSSSCVYGDKEVMREDDIAFDLHTPYAVSKLLGEHYAALWARHWHLDVVTVRPFNAYGPHEHPGAYRNVIPNFFALANQGEPLPITGTGAETRDFTFVSDTVAGMVGALLGDTAPGDIFNIGTGVETRIDDLANRINRITGNDAGLEYRGHRDWDHSTRRRADVTKAREAFGYEPQTTLEEGLMATHEWLNRVFTPSL